MNLVRALALCVRSAAPGRDNLRNIAVMSHARVILTAGYILGSIFFRIAGVYDFPNGYAAARGRDDAGDL